MNIGDFSVTVKPGVESGEGYISLPHNTQYSIDIKSNLNRRCAAVVSVDGKQVGTFRINSYGSLTLERPSGDTGKFTFYQDGTQEAKAAETEKVFKADRGLISIEFKPEKSQSILEESAVMDSVPLSYRNPRGHGQNVNSVSRSYYKCSMSESSAEVKTKGLLSGGTGLSGKSNQTFKTVGNLDYDDSSTFVTINLRLVAQDNTPRPLKESNGRSNPVPMPV